MRVRVTNFTSVATVDFPLVLISGCVDNYSDQVILLPEKCIELMFGANIESFDALQVCVLSLMCVVLAVRYG